MGNTELQILGSFTVERDTLVAQYVVKCQESGSKVKSKRKSESSLRLAM